MEKRKYIVGNQKMGNIIIVFKVAFSEKSVGKTKGLYITGGILW